MKSLLTILFIVMTTIAIAQPLGDIEKDTALANQLYIEATEVTDDFEAKMNLLVKANALYEPYRVYEKEIEIKSHLAYAAYDAYEDSLSEAIAYKAINIAKEHLKDDLRSELYYSYYTILRLYHLSNLQMAIEYGEKATQIAAKPSDEYFDAMFFVISNHIYNDDLSSAKALIKKVEILITDDTWLKYLAPLYRSKMQLSYHQRNFEKSVSFGRQALIENKKHHYFSIRETGPISLEIGNALRELGNYEAAIQAIKDGIEYTKPTGGILATYYVSLASNYESLKGAEKAIEFYRKAIELYKKQPTVYKVHLQVTNSMLSILYSDMKDYELALFYIQESFLYGETTSTKQSYANLLSTMERYDEALVLTQEAIIELSTDFKENDIYVNPSKYEVYSNNYLALGILQTKTLTLINRGIKRNNPKDVKEGIKTGILFKEIRQKLLEGMYGFDETKLKNTQEFQNFYNILIKGQHYLSLSDDKYVTEVFNTMEERKSMLLLETLTPSKLPDSLALQQELLVKKMRKQEQQLSLVTKDSTDYYQTLFFEANNQLENFLKELDENYPKQASNFYNIQYATLDEIQKNLEEETIIMEYVNMTYNEGENYLYVYLISKSSKKIVKIPIENDFFEKVMQLNNYLKNPFLVQQTNREKFTNLSNQLYQVLIQPLSKELKNKSKLVIIPERELFHLPFEVLLVSKKSKPFHELDFLIKNFDISYQYSATIYQQLKQKTAITNKSFLGFAPVFENGQAIVAANRSLDFMVDSLYESIDNNKFIGLPNTKKEVETIAGNINENGGKTTILLKEKATKKQFQTKLNQSYQFIHIATHGLVNYQNPKLSALACFENGTAVANDLLFANEIQMQDIRADLVVLSSCESGIGQLVKGEGLIALNRSFIYAGANNVLFSLWKVNDEYTSKLMIDFYQSYLENESYTAALRQAKLKMLKDKTMANPRFWATFVLIGE